MFTMMMMIMMMMMMIASIKRPFQLEHERCITHDKYLKQLRKKVKRKLNSNLKKLNS